MKFTTTIRLIRKWLTFYRRKKKNKPPHHQIRVCHIHAYSQSSTLTLSAPPRRAGTQQTLNPELPTARDNKGEREETAPPVICWFLSPGSSVTWEDAVGTLGRQSLRGSRDACIWMNHAHTLCPLPEGLTWMTRGCNTSQNQQRPPQRKITYRDTACSTLQTSRQQKTLSEGNFLLMCFSSSTKGATSAPRPCLQFTAKRHYWSQFFRQVYKCLASLAKHFLPYPKPAANSRLTRGFTLTNLTSICAQK